MSYPDDLRYSKEHEWVRVEDGRATIGITSFAADELGDIVFIELPETGSTLSQFGTFGVVESVKAVSDLFAPVSGEVAEVNEKLRDARAAHSDKFREGWIARVTSPTSQLAPHGRRRVAAENDERGSP